MYKFRTMHADRRALASTITAKQDPRVFPFGAWLRRFKIDELPQLLNILRGEMSFIGPRPEDPHIVERFYAAVGLETLRVLPGLASPGSLYHYTHGESRLDARNPEQSYLEHVLPIKLALDVVYVREASFLHDLRIAARTLWTIASIALGTSTFPDPPEMHEAARFMHRTTRPSG